MKQYTVDEYIKTFGEQMYKEKIEDTLSEYEKERGIDKIYATDLGNVGMVFLKEQEL